MKVGGKARRERGPPTCTREASVQAQLSHSPAGPRLPGLWNTNTVTGRTTTNSDDNTDSGTEHEDNNNNSVRCCLHQRCQGRRQSGRTTRAPSGRP